MDQNVEAADMILDGQYFAHVRLNDKQLLRRLFRILRAVFDNVLYVLFPVVDQDYYYYRYKYQLCGGRTEFSARVALATTLHILAYVLAPDVVDEYRAFSDTTVCVNMTRFWGAVIENLRPI